MIMAAVKIESQTVEGAAAALNTAQQNRVTAAGNAKDLTDRVAELELRLRSGDLSVTPKTLTDARRDAEHATLLVDSHDGIVQAAVKAHAQARLVAVGAVAQRVATDLCKAFDRVTGPLVDQLADMLSALHTARSDINACHAGEGALSLVPKELTTTVPGVKLAGMGYELDIELPTLEEFLGEVLAVAADRAGVDRSAIAAMQSTPHRYDAVDIKRIMNRWYGQDGKVAPELAKHVTPARLAGAGH